VGLTLGVQETGGILRQALEIGAWILRESDIELVPTSTGSPRWPVVRP
jgi:hypothetical protein